MSSLALELKQAVELHQSGEIRAAERLYEKILRCDPGHSDALHLLGVAAHQGGRSSEAVLLIRRAIASNGSSALYHCNLGSACRAIRQYDEALASFREAIRLDPSLAGAQYNLAMTFEESGRLDDAAAAYRETVRIDPTFAAAYNNLGRLLATRGETEAAIDAFRSAVNAKPDSAESNYNLGNMLAKLGRHAEAIPLYESARRLAPTVAEILNNLGTSLLATGDDSAAAECCRAAIRLRPDYAEAHNNLGSALQHVGNIAGAEESYRRAVSLQTVFPGALTNLGNVANERGDVTAAIELYERALAQDADSPEARFNRALAWLRIGDFERGWPAYEGRWKRKVKPRAFSAPLWQGELLAGKTILAYAEQGIGDEIQFASCIPDLIALGGHCVIECDARLVALFMRSYPQTTVVARDCSLDAELTHQAEFQIAFGSLPRHFRGTIGHFPSRPSYLVADPVGVAKSRSRMANDRLHVGISWLGGSEPDARRKRSIPLTHWSPLLSMSGIDFHSLQYGDCREELAAVRSSLGVEIVQRNDLDCWKDLDGLAAKIAAFDLVITVDNSTAHLAGALGVPVWTLLPFASDWRWLMHRENSPWYPSMRLFRQRRLGDWNSVLEQVAFALTRHHS